MKSFLLVATFLAAMIISAAGHLTTLWISEAGHLIILACVLAATYRRFQFTWLTYMTLLAFALVVFTGAHYTYALVPLGEWVRPIFGFERNHFDRVAHFFQGVAPAMFVRELLIRRSGFRRGGSLFWIVCGLSLGMAALFELAEWKWAMAQGGPVIDDLGAQGDPWDAQQDMLMALYGASLAQLAFARLQDREITARFPATSVQRVTAGK